MARKLDLKVDQKVIVKIIDGSYYSKNKDMSLKNINEWCYDGEVTKIGRKYITVKWNEIYEYQFSKEDNYRDKTDCSYNYQLYLNKEEIIEEEKAEGLYRNIRNTYFERYSCNNGRFTVNQLEGIMNIINEGNK